MDTPKNLLVGVDFSPRSFSAAQMAIKIAEPIGANVELAHVVETKLSDSDAAVLGKSKSRLVDMLVDEAHTALDSFSAHFSYGKLTRTVLTGSPANEITTLCNEHNVDLLVIGDTGAGSSAQPIGVGITAYRLVESGPRNVLVVKAGHTDKITSVAAAISFVPVANDVLRQAYLLASILNVELHILRAIPDIAELRNRLAILPNDIDRLLSNSLHYNESRLQNFVDSFGINDVQLKTVILQGKPGPTLVEYLHKEEINIIVVGTGTSYRIAGYPVGSNTHRVLNQTLSSVCVVRSLEPSP